MLSKAASSTIFWVFGMTRHGIEPWFPRSSHTKDSKIVLDAALLNTQHYKVRIKGKVEQSKNRVAPSLPPWCCNYWKGALGSPFTKVTNFTWSSDYLMSNQDTRKGKSYSSAVMQSLYSTVPALWAKAIL